MVAAGALFGVADSSRLVFTANATHALNLAIRGLATGPGRVLVSPLEHNSVMRPVRALEKSAGIRVEVMPHDPSDGRVLPDEIAPRDDTLFAVVNMVSNVNGVTQPVAEIKRRLGDIPLVVDAAQAAGDVPIDANELDLLAMAGHKHLLGPFGTGALYVRPGIELSPLMPGGTGSRSESQEHPLSMPDSLEGGTPNMMGIAGLGAAAELLARDGLGDLGATAASMAHELEKIPEVTVYRASRREDQGESFRSTSRTSRPPRWPSSFSTSSR